MTGREVEEALAAVDATTRAYRRTEKAHKAASEASMQAALDALRLGVGPAEVARRSPFEPAYLRRRAREAGIPPARESVRRRSSDG